MGDRVALDGVVLARSDRPSLVFETDLPVRVGMTANADLVSESVFERLDIKRETHRLLDEICPARTILTTNSSALPVSAPVIRCGWKPE